MLDQVKGLYGLGFAIHLLHPKSKRPIGLKWATSPRSSWDKLTLDFKLGMNVGTNLGGSVVDGNHLAVIDCDVKSLKPEHQKEMNKKLIELFGLDFTSYPTVLSGRGNGSKHIYILSKDEIKQSQQRLAQSTEMVEVYMPSTKPSKKDIEVLGPKTEEGLRLRAAWEISLMGTGAQVVLPPSIHPDSGKPYRWKTGTLPEAKDFRLVDLSSILSAPRPEGDGDEAQDIDFKFEPLDSVDLKRLGKRDRSMLETGEGCDDRSSAAFLVAMGLIKAGYSLTEILTVLTDTTYFLGQIGFDHAKTESRKRAAKWVYKYCYLKAKQSVDADIDFATEVITETLSEDAAATQLEIVKQETDWRTLLDSTYGKEGFKYKNTVRNLVLILSNMIRPDVIKYDSFANRGFYSVDTPWAKEGEGITDEHMIDIKMWVRDLFGYEATKDKVYEAVSRLQSTNKFHPVREYLDSLEWDGVARANFWLRDYAGAADNRYTRDVSRKILVAMVARAYKAGTKFDYVPILEGYQGARKSTLIAALAGHQWFTDQEFNIKDKDAVSTLQGRWVVELGELSSIRKADLESLKSFISRTEDHIRLPYGRLVCAFPRQGVFIGSTNQGEFLQDDTGNRRFWPVHVRTCDPEGLLKVRDQLFAEAVMFYEMGERLYLDNAESQEIAKREQADKMISDSWVELIEEIMKNEAEKEPEKRVLNPDRFLLKDLKKFEPFCGLQESVTHDRRMGSCLRKAGYVKRVLKEKGTNKKYWIRDLDPL